MTVVSVVVWRAAPGNRSTVTVVRPRKFGCSLRRFLSSCFVDNNADEEFEDDGSDDDVVVDVDDDVVDVDVDVDVEQMFDRVDDLNQLIGKATSTL